MKLDWRTYSIIFLSGLLYFFLGDYSNRSNWGYCFRQSLYCSQAIGIWLLLKRVPYLNLIISYLMTIPFYGWQLHLEQYSSLVCLPYQMIITALFGTGG